MEDDMRPKVVLVLLAVMAALGGWATTEAADRGAYYYNPDRSQTYYYYPDRSYTYYYPNRGYTYYYYRDDNPYYSYGDPHRNYINEYSSDRYDPYGIKSHDTN
jgi:hypothetical protein